MRGKRVHVRFDADRRKLLPLGSGMLVAKVCGRPPDSISVGVWVFSLRGGALHWRLSSFTVEFRSFSGSLSSQEAVSEV